MGRIDVMKRLVPRRCLIVVVGLITTSSFLFAQERSTDSQTNEVAPEFASAFVPRGSWLHDTLRKLHALYLLPARFDPSSISITQREAGRMLLRSIEKARQDFPEVLSLTELYWARFSEEFTRTARLLEGHSVPPILLGGSSVSVGYESTRNTLLGAHVSPGVSTGGISGGPVPFSDIVSAVVEADLSFQLSPHLPVLAGRITPRLAGDNLTIQEGYVTLEVGDVALWVGRRAPGYGPGFGGTVMLDGEVAVDGGGVVLTDGVDLPGFLNVLGPFRSEIFFSRLQRSGEILDPWFFGYRLSIAPHDRLELAINRAGMFGGTGNELDTTFWRFMNAVLGAAPPDGFNFENQVASGEIRYLAPLGNLPVSLYLEWGFEDWAGAYDENPGLIAGAELGGLPGLPEVSVGFEWASFAGPGATGRRWFRHGVFEDNWTVQGRLLAHPLGGDGSEFRLLGGIDAVQARLRGRWHVAFQDRGSTNLFAPDREGKSWEVGGSLGVRLWSLGEIIGTGMTRWGSSVAWRETSAFAGFRILF